MSLTNHSPKPFAPDSEENKEVILAAIREFLQERKTVLEIASGTGQHAIYFAQKLPHLEWQTSDLNDCHVGINQWLEESKLGNVLPPICLDVSKELHWPERTFDAVFSANSFHIMAKPNVEDFFKHLPKVLNANAVVMIYGPFNYQGRFTSESNARFDQWLKKRNPQSGIKDFEWCNQLAEKAGLRLLKDIEMPQNNRTLIWNYYV